MSFVIFYPIPNMYCVRFWSSGSVGNYISLITTWNYTSLITNNYAIILMHEFKYKKILKYFSLFFSGDLKFSPRLKKYHFTTVESFLLPPNLLSVSITSEFKFFFHWISHRPNSQDCIQLDRQNLPFNQNFPINSTIASSPSQRLLVTFIIEPSIELEREEQLAKNVTWQSLKYTFMVWRKMYHFDSTSKNVSIICVNWWMTWNKFEFKLILIY